MRTCFPNMAHSCYSSNGNAQHLHANFKRKRLHHFTLDTLKVPKLSDLALAEYPPHVKCLCSSSAEEHSRRSTDAMLNMVRFTELPKTIFGKKFEAWYCHACLALAPLAPLAGSWQRHGDINSSPWSHAARVTKFGWTLIVDHLTYLWFVYGTVIVVIRNTC